MNDETFIPSNQVAGDDIGVTIDFDKPWRLGAEVFTGKRMEADRDMVQCIVDILARNGHPNPSDWTQCVAIAQARSMPPEGQIFQINRYWRLHLAEMIDVDTMLQRRALMDVVASYSDYLHGFEVAVAPYVIPKAEEPIQFGVAPIDPAVVRCDTRPAEIPSSDRQESEGKLAGLVNSGVWNLPTPDLDLDSGGIPGYAPTSVADDPAYFEVDDAGTLRPGSMDSLASIQE